MFYSDKEAFLDFVMTECRVGGTIRPQVRSKDGSVGSVVPSCKGLAERLGCSHWSCDRVASIVDVVAIVAIVRALTITVTCGCFMTI